MREIIFRGKTVIEEEFYNVCEFWQRKIIENGKWVQGDLIWNNGFPYIVHGVIESNDEYISLEWWMPVDPETIGQYTGLKDKNGKMIFEGDNFIVETWEDDGRKSLAYFTVCWDSEGLCWYSKSFADSMFDELLGDIVDDSLEIIGNIHDKKEDV